MTSFRGAYKKKQLNIENVLARFELLTDSLAAPNNVEKSLYSALDSQRSFAALSIKGTPIKEISLNTLKSISNEVLGSGEAKDGFLLLDQLRAELKRVGTAKKASRTIPAKVIRLNEELLILKNRLQQVDLLNLQRSKAYSDLFQKVLNVSTGKYSEEATKKILSHLVQHHRSIFSSLFNPTSAEDSSKVIYLVAGSSNED